jgi:hypothetical protein
MKKRSWSVSTHKDWNKVTFYEFGLKNQIKNFIGNTWETIDTLTGHLFCTGSIGKSELLWRVPIGKSKYDYEYLDEENKPFLTNSAANYLLDLNNFILNWTDSTWDEDKITSIEIPKEKVVELAPSLDFILEEI